MKFLQVEGRWKLQVQQKWVVEKSLELEREDAGMMEEQTQQAVPWEDPETSWEEAIHGACSEQGALGLSRMHTAQIQLQ